MERVLDRSRNFNTVIIKARACSPFVQQFVRKQLEQRLSKDGNALNWLHPQVLPFFEDDLFQASEASLMQHTKTLVMGVLSSLEKLHESDPLLCPMIYEALAKELTSRIRRVWIQSKGTGPFGQVRLQHYLLKLIDCLSHPAMEQHSPLAVVVVEMSILLMISLSTKADTQAGDLIPSSGCEVCVRGGQDARKHYELVSLIHKLFASNDKITLQSIADSPTSSPLSVLCAEGLDPGSAFFLVTKLMHWHHLALAEAQALAVCSSWVSSNSKAPFTDSLVRRLAKMQTEAERCALQSNENKYIYDDVMDAWIAQGSQDLDPGIQSTQMVPSLVQKSNSQITRSSRRHSEPMHTNYPRAQQASTSTNDDDENDELDLLKDTSNIQSARVCRKVKRLDVGLEARKYRKVNSSTCRRSFHLAALDSMPFT